MRHFFIIGTFIAGVTAGPYDGGIAPANLNCPAGFVLNGKKCEQNIFTPAQVTCALGQLQGNKCVTTAQTIQTCPIGSTQENNECKIFQYDQPEIECPSGFALEGASCMQKIPLPIQEVCDVGRPDGKGGCFATERVSKVTKRICPVGYQDEGNGCSKTTTYDCSPDEVHFPKPVFPTPAPLTKGKAAALPIYSTANKNWKRMLGAKRSYAPLTIAPLAPAPSKGAPIPIKTQLPAPVPASNVAVVKQLCQRQDYAPYVSEHFCPQGYAPEGDSCFATATYPMSQRCVNGNPITSCYEPKIAPVNRACKIGALVGDRCVLARTLGLETVCPAGTERIGNACQQYTTPTITCPPGQMLEGQNCVGKIFTEPTGVVTTTCHGKECWQH